MAVATVCWTAGAVVLLDQTKLPDEETELVCRDVAALVDAIKRLAVRGAPALGVAGAYGVALGASRHDDPLTGARDAAAELSVARPTAVNLAWGVRAALTAAEVAAEAGRDVAVAALAAARGIAEQDAAASDAMAAHGLPLVPAGARVLTHCNTGALVSAGGGTAFGLVAAAHRAGILRHLWVDETRPLLQGARLTAWEARRAGIPHSLLPDGAAGSLFARGEVELVVIGADRICADGSVVNKIGSYSLAVLAEAHGVPFIVVAPTSTIDLATASGDDVEIEHRAGEEVTSYAGRAVAPAGTIAYNPAFDVTPPRLVTAVVTETGVARPVDAARIAALVASS
ncbi:MAG TPA: S-methyl-5-thioribose-1-phosphate isomerase [Mycobacteriales bacterium]|nr:S-methyl-5-thioribose-1-phosphate isomerase [Mycobacteriales bacterium]